MAAMVKAKREDTAIAAKSIQSSTVQQLPAVGRRVFQQQLTVGRINEDSSLGAWKLQHFTLHGLDLVEEEDVQQPRRVHVKAHTTSRLEAKREWREHCHVLGAASLIPLFINGPIDN
ncbi:hypothetical protein VIGAN_11122700 [Vigna angularis var. angularis]|uniref:Uncharacterized protein n=1 Tax=Vigna angularis var. angularis TaxID=157739 RepID=A0A0S3TAP9_PHAAN|nr:hypothetical protein VIGAN_11122700 [Vigna angularis var. angularis]